MPSKTTFVSAYYTLHETPYFNLKPEEWDPAPIFELARTGIQLCLYIGPDCAFEQAFVELEKECPNFRVMPYRLYYKDMWTIKALGENPMLPNNRNLEKDTLEYMVYMHSRPEIIEDAISENLWDSTHFAWIDFNAPRLFSKKTEAFERLKEIAAYPFPETASYFAGCWPRMDDGGAKAVASSIHWRFCGAFYLADIKSHLAFAETYRNKFEEFLTATNGVLSWEVNYWAWLEFRFPDSWKPTWYKGDHNDQMLNLLAGISADTYATPLIDSSSSQHNNLRVQTLSDYSSNASLFEYSVIPNLVENVERRSKTTVYTYPLLEPFLPGSASYLEHEGQHYLNTRFVNYWMYPSGYYRFHSPDLVIENRNFVSRLDPDSLEPLDYREMDEKTLFLSDGSVLEKPAREKRPFSVGLEDIRLFSGIKGDPDAKRPVRFIATNVEYSANNKNRMVLGTYDLDTATYRDCVMVVPPDPNSWCEKNWIPVLMRDQNGLEQECFIYKWSPMEIGRVDPLTKQLEIVLRHEVRSWLFGRLRGSTTFVEAPRINGIEGDYLVGVAHFSEEHSPRHYYHVLVLLEKETLKPVRYSRVFYFEKLSIEFCIGFCVRSDKYAFWVSRFDRDPVLIEVGIEELKLDNVV